jgi:hypothetical protein
MAITEISLNGIDLTLKNLVSQNIPSEENIQIICHDSYFKDLLILTEVKAYKISVKPYQSISHSSYVKYEFVTSIHETIIKDIISSSHIISLWGQDPGKALMGFDFPKKDDLYYKFLSILKTNLEKIQNKTNPIPQPQKSPEERIREIDYLLSKNLITIIEYQTKRQEILRDL